MIRNIISSNIDSLNDLNKQYIWLPNSESIRPNQFDLTHKQYRLNQITNEWVSLADYIRFKIFGQKAYLNSLNKKQILVKPDQATQHILPKFVFAESEFKYNLIPESNHWIMWLSEFTQNEMLTIELINTINEEITNQLTKIIGSEKFDFAWYKNPKPTVDEFLHVQVFWIRLSEKIIE